jgi:hypothetical protein
MGKTDGEIAQPQATSFDLGFTVKTDQRLAARFSQYFNLLPANPLNARAQGFHHGFFASEAGRQSMGFLLTYPQFRLGVNPVQEALAKAPPGSFNAVNFYDVNPNPLHLSLHLTKLEAYSSTISGLIEDPVSGFPETDSPQVVYQPHPLCPPLQEWRGGRKEEEGFALLDTYMGVEWEEF